jgi:hypothetical protein
MAEENIATTERPFDFPAEIHRRFMALAGMLEIADREFQAIQDADRKVTVEARESVKSGDLVGVEITPDALHSFLDKRLGSDWRISDWTYNWTARLLKKFGFRDLKQVETAIANYDDGQLSYLIWGARQGQTTRFELMLLASLGTKFIERHNYNAADWFRESAAKHLAQFQQEGIKIGTFDPLENQPAVPSDSVLKGKVIQ